LLSYVICRSFSPSLQENSQLFHLPPYELHETSISIPDLSTPPMFPALQISIAKTTLRVVCVLSYTDIIHIQLHNDAACVRAVKPGPKDVCEPRMDPPSLVWIVRLMVHLCSTSGLESEREGFDMQTQCILKEIIPWGDTDYPLSIKVQTSSR
jgi:hypothetical protein